MKLKIRIDSEDLMIFGLFALFLLYVVAIMVANLSSLATDGVISGLNPLPAFSGGNLVATLVFYFLTLGVLIISVSSRIFELDKGIGFTTDKKDKGYSRWAKEKEMKAELSQITPLQKTSNVAGVPLILKDNEAWIDNSEYHTLVIGATGSGKTQTVIKPTVKFLAKKGESMIITDPKGEIYEATAEMLKDKGYQILLLNFRDPQNGNAWNPMSLPYKIYKSGKQDKAIELLDDLALNILYDESNANADPFWEKTSADYFAGLALGLFEDAKEEEININSINLMSTVGEDKFGGSTYIKEYFTAKDPSSAAAINAFGTVTAPSETKGSILSVFKQKVKLFASRENLSEMLSYSDINLETIGERPTAVFIVIQDEKKTYHSLVTILLKQIYETLISVAQRHGGKLPVRTNFLLDEFANMPPLKDVTTMITAARSRAIRFTMIIQNFAQLDDVYGKEEAETIRGNCGNIVYLITTELKALEEISKMCGEQKSKKDDKTASTPLVTVSDLQRMKQFEVIILRMRKQPFKTKFTPYFKLDWGRNYPPAKYPTRPKRELHTFDIKEFVKSQKKKKLLDMMNSSDDKEKDDLSMPAIPGMPKPSPFGGSDMPNEFRQRPKQETSVPDFLTRKNNTSMDEDKDIPKIPDFETFKKQMEASAFGGFDDDEEVSVPKKAEPVIPAAKKDDSFDDDDDLGFDVDELVKKIDAKIAELEAEEKRNKELEKAEEKETNIPSVTSTPFSTLDKLPEDTEEVYSPKFEEKVEENFISKPIKPVVEEVKSTPTVNINLDEEDGEDDFFDDFFDN